MFTLPPGFTAYTSGIDAIILGLIFIVVVQVVVLRAASDTTHNILLWPGLNVPLALEREPLRVVAPVIE